MKHEELITDYISSHSTPENEALRQINRRTHIHTINPRMLSGHIQGRVLSMLSQMIHPKRVLELGTFAGYSALCLAEGLQEGGEVVTIEKNDELEDFIRENLSLSPLGEKVHLIIGTSSETLASFIGTSSEMSDNFIGTLSETSDNFIGTSSETSGNFIGTSSETSATCVGNQSHDFQQFDLVFMDADKREYIHDYDLLFPLVAVGGWILADNTLWDGHIVEPEYDNDKQTCALREFNDYIKKDHRVEQVILPIRDGLTIIRKIAD